MNQPSGDIENLLLQAKTAFREDDADQVRRLIELHPILKEHINDPLGPFDSPPIANVRSRRMLDLLLEAGADINAKSRWWAAVSDSCRRQSRYRGLRH
jgi:hypothetical protein